MKRTLSIGGSLLALLAALGIGRGVVEQPLLAQAKAPALKVDPFWPKPLGNHWILGSVTGVAVDAQDHVWVVHRGLPSLQNNEKGPTLEPWASSCCFSAPQVLEFAPSGALVAHWGGPGPGYDWPQSPAGLAVDAKGDLWIGSGLPTPSYVPPARGGRGRGAAGRGGRGGPPPGPPPPADAQVLKFSKDGKFLLQIGKAGQAGNDESQTSLNRPAGLEVDDAANEVYVADGYGNHRVIVFDAGTGAFKRMWGAYGEKPSGVDPGKYDPAAPPARTFHTVSCVHVSRDGMVYVCDRQNDRIQVFQKDGKFVKEGFIAKQTTGDGSVWDLAFSRDPQQRLLYVADGHDKKVWIVDRSSLQVVGTLGDGGRLPGHFYAVGSIAVDSHGNVFTGETYEGKRVQKFVAGR